MNFPQEFLDVNGLVLPQPRKPEDIKPCDNGVLFTSIAKVLGFNFPNYEFLVRSCYLDKGLVARWKGNNFDQAAWDDYLGIAVCCIKFKIKNIPREILMYGFKHLFIFNTDKKLEFKDFLGRNFPIWPIMICAAFPFMKYPMYPVLWIVQMFFKPVDYLLDVKKDSSAAQLQWFYLNGCANLGFYFKSFDDHLSLMSRCFEMYYHKDHPFNVNFGVAYDGD